MAQVLSRLPVYPNPNVLVGYETADDAGVYLLDENRALVQTVDFFTPVVDDPCVYGAIAAANSLSDVYAMGGRPLTAMAVACFPARETDLELLALIMRGGLEKLREAGVALVGGHTVADNEIKFGYSVTGIVDPRRMTTNAAARPGDALVLTKPLGIGILTSGIKFQKASRAGIEKAVETMSRLNREASEIMLRHVCHAATDITGNGLLGHALEMAEASCVTLRFTAATIPYIEEAYSLAEAGVLPGAAAKTMQMIKNKTLIGGSVPRPLQDILVDPQTSGGLLIAVSRDAREALMRDLSKAGVPAAEVGQVEEIQGSALVVE